MAEVGSGVAPASPGDDLRQRQKPDDTVQSTSTSFAGDQTECQRVLWGQGRGRTSGDCIMMAKETPKRILPKWEECCSFERAPLNALMRDDSVRIFPKPQSRLHVGCLVVIVKAWK